MDMLHLFLVLCVFVLAFVTANDRNYALDEEGDAFKMNRVSISGYSDAFFVHLLTSLIAGQTVVEGCSNAGPRP